MKKIILASGFLFLGTAVTFAQENSDRNDAKEVSLAIKSQFAADFPGATNVHFTSEKNFNEVSFTQDKETISAYYNDRDLLVGTIQKQTFADLPENAKQEITKKYAGYAIANVIKFDDSESDETERILYGASFDDADNYFVELKNDSGAIVVKVNLSGGVDFLTTMK
jgi:hypothetical protein